MAEDKPEKSSLMKKEISLSFRRKPKAPKLPKVKVEETDGPAAEAPEKPARKKRTHRTQRSLRRQGGSQKRAKRVVGLKIGASQLAAARIVNNGHPELVQVAREDLEAGLIVGGELREPERLADALRAFFRKNKLPRTGVRLGIANNRIGVRIFEIAGIQDPKALENAIRFRAQEALPIPIEEAVLDYHVLSERVDDEGQKVRRILLVVAYRELIDRYVAACKKAGIRLAGIDLEAFALLRALGDPGGGRRQPGRRRARRRLGRPRPLNLRRLRRPRLRVHPRPRLGRPDSRHRDRARARRRAFRGGSLQAGALARRGERARGPDAGAS